MADAFDDSDWEHLLSSSTPSTTSYSPNDRFLSVFPPIDHEDLPVAPSFEDSHRQPPAAAVTATANVTSAPENTNSQAGEPSRHQRFAHSHSPHTVSLVGKWADFALRMLVSKVVSVVSSVRSGAVMFSFPFASSVSGGGVMAGAALMALGVWIWWSRKRRRRPPPGSVDDTTQRLNALIREKDEKIMELLNQVAELNRVLLARYRVAVVREC